MLPEGLSAFAQALIDPDAEVPSGVVNPDGAPAPKRFAVYRNNVTVSLVDALAAKYPAVEALVGEEFFRQMALLFVRNAPPQSPLLKDYGDDFPDFIAGFEPAKRLPFLRDVARVDAAWLKSYHAADATPLAPEKFAAIEHDALATVTLQPLPATTIIASRFPVVSLWNAGRAKTAAAGIDPQKPESALLVRPDLNVDVVALNPATGQFFMQIINGAPLGEAGETAAADKNFDLGGALALMIGSGAFGALVRGET